MKNGSKTGEDSQEILHPSKIHYKLNENNWILLFHRYADLHTIRGKHGSRFLSRNEALYEFYHSQTLLDPPL
jgi:hypothetical protein